MDTYIYLLITMAFSAFFSGMEIAFVSVDKLRFEMERKEGLTSRILSYFFRNSNNFICAGYLWYPHGASYQSPSPGRFDLQ